MKPDPRAARPNLVCFSALAAVAPFLLGGCGAKPSKAGPVSAAPPHYRLTMTPLVGALINDRGEICGMIGSGRKNPSSQQPDRETEHLAVWQNGKVQDLGTLDGDDWCDPAAINSHGEVAGTFGPYAVRPGDVGEDSISRFFWSRGKMHDLGPAGGVSALNDQGQVVGWKSWPDGQHGFVYQGGTTREVKNPLGTSVSKVIAINNRGQMVQVAFDAGGQIGGGHVLGGSGRVHAFLVGGSKVTELTSPPAYSLNLYSRLMLTDAGKVLFTDRDDVGKLPGFGHTDIVATNTQGVSVGAASQYDALLGRVKYRAVVRQSGTLYDLNSLVPGHMWALEHAAGLNSRGQIIGYGEDAKGRVQGFLLTPITK